MVKGSEEHGPLCNAVNASEVDVMAPIPVKSDVADETSVEAPVSIFLC